jgi:hypothetical protein
MEARMDTQVSDTLKLLDKHLSPTVRHNIEQQYYEKINAQASINVAIKDPLFLTHPLHHISLTTDHGLVHVRDVASRVLQQLEQLNGVHFPKRNAARLEFMKGYGAMLAYVHDIGMLEVKSTDHDMHAQAAAQMLFNDFFDKQLSILWDENSGNVAWRITKLAYKKIFAQQPRNILREMLALCGAHTRDTISSEQLNHPGELRQKMQEMIAYHLPYQWLQHQVTMAEKSLIAAEHLDPKQRERFAQEKFKSENALQQALDKKETSTQVNSFLKLYYEDFFKESFLWLVTDNPEARELVDDVIDTLRTLRCANASRQRGAKLRATGDHQIFLDHHSANAIYAINANQKVYLLESKNTLLAGEVNLSSTEFTQAGDLRISFYRGSFADDTATDRAVFNAAVAINEVQEDMIGCFARPAAGDDNSSADYSKKWQKVFILLENCDDNPQFANNISNQLAILNPKLKDSVHIVPSLQNAAEQERNRYLAAEELQWDLKTENEMLDKIANSGHKVSSMQAKHAFNHVKCAEVHAGEILMQVGTIGSFVYVPMSEGLVGYPLGGYKPFHPRSYIPLGNVGVIRGDTRNAQVVAENSLKVLMIPREVYLQYWHNTYNEAEFVQLIADHISLMEK